MTRTRTAALLAAVIAVGIVLRLWHPGADPPRWLTASYAPLIDGPLYAAEAAAREGAAADPASADPTGGVPPWYRKALYTALCQLVYRATGASPRTLALPSALAGAALAPAVFLLLVRAVGAGTALAAALFVAVDAIGVGWSRTLVPYPAVALAEAVALAFAAAGLGFGARPVVRSALFALAFAAIAFAAWGLKPIAFSALAPLAVVGWEARTAPPGPARRGGHLAAWLAGAGLVLGAVFLLWDDLLEAVGRVRVYSGEPTLAGAVRRLFHLPAATRVSALAPVVVALVLAAPVLLRPRRPRTTGLRVTERAALATTAAGVIVLAALLQPDMPYLVAFWPGALVVAAVALHALAVGDAQPLGRPGLAAGYLVAALTFTALDGLVSLVPWLARARGPICPAPDWACEWPGFGRQGVAALAAALDWLGDPYYLGAQRFLRTFLVAILAGLLGAVLGAWRSRRQGRPSPPRPWLAAAIAAIHVAWQLALSASILVRPEETLRAARMDTRAILPPGAVLGEHFAYALADGHQVRARYFVAQRAGGALAEARQASVTHVAVAVDRWGTLAREPLGGAGGSRGPEPIASLYIGTARVQIARLSGVRSDFEGGRALMERNDLAGARAALAKAVETVPGAPLPRVHLAVAEALAGDLARAAGTLEQASGAARDSFPVRVARTLVLVRQGDLAQALRELERAHALFPDRNLGRFYRDLRSALARGDEDALSRLRGVRVEVLVTDLLR